AVLLLQPAQLGGGGAELVAEAHHLAPVRDPVHAEAGEQDRDRRDAAHREPPVVPHASPPARGSRSQARSLAERARGLPRTSSSEATTALRVSTRQIG